MPTDRPLSTVDPRPWRTRLLVAAMGLAAHRRSARVAGLRLTLAPGVCNPSPIPGVSFARLFRAALRALPPDAPVLEIGTGAGVWALLATRAGAQVTATDLPHVPLAPVRANATANGLRCPELLTGDLFAPVAGRRFQRVLFNPPFHVGHARTPAEQAYLGGPGGAVVRRFLAELPSHLTPDGAGYIVLPRHEAAQYADALAALTVRPVARQWVPLMGRVDCLELTAP